MHLWSYELPVIEAKKHKINFIIEKKLNEQNYLDLDKLDDS